MTGIPWHTVLLGCCCLVVVAVALAAVFLSNRRGRRRGHWSADHRAVHDRAAYWGSARWAAGCRDLGHGYPLQGAPASKIRAKSASS